MPKTNGILPRIIAISLEDPIFHHIALLSEASVHDRCSSRAPLLDHLVGSSEQRRWNVDAKRLGGLERWEGTLRDVLSEAASENALPPGLNPCDAAAFILNAWEGALLRMKAERSPQPLHIIMRSIFEQYLRRSGS